MELQSIKKELSDIFVEKGIISPDILLQALDVLRKENPKTRRRLPQILVEDFNIDRNQVYQQVADYYAFRTVDLSQTTIDDARVAFIRKELNNLPLSMRTMAQESKVLPFAADPERPDRLLVITTDPTQRDAYFIARRFSFQKFILCYVPATQWEGLWKMVSLDRQMYKDKRRDVRGEDFTEEAVEDLDHYEQALEEEINRSGLVDLVQGILQDAVLADASDVHVIPLGEKVTEFHFRIDGTLTLWCITTEARAEAVAAVVKDRAKNLDRFERSTAQDGFAQLTVDKRTVRFRVSVLPLVGKELKNRFESIVIRILKEPAVGTRMEDLRFDAYSEKYFRKAIQKPHGMVIVTGPTGSGKSTTLVGALRTLINPARNVLTVEDPVEYYLERARQVKLNPKLNFEQALRAILRHDPDIVMVGEIRDRVTADIAIKLANTGHLTLSTLHTNDALSAVSRLYKMGVEPFLLAYSINLVLAQRLLRKLCPRCKSPIGEPDVDLLVSLGFPEEEIAQTQFYRPIGCIDCINGYRGRIAIHEALFVSKAIRHLILEAGSTINEEALREQALKQGMWT
ncbi:MAG: GspE/PulE family protein, partial [Bacteroidota bacterium]